MSCVGIFTVAASFACGAAPTLPIMLLARVIQGAGGGALQPLSQGILLESFPPARRGATIAVFAFGVVVAPVLGPNVTLELSPTTLLVSILITGFALSFVFVPISNAAYGTLDHKQIGSASGLFNLIRKRRRKHRHLGQPDAPHPPRRRSSE